jgi:hypothetical protein
MPKNVRTTLVIPDPVFRRARKRAEERRRNLSQLVTEALDSELARVENGVRKTRAVYEVPTFRMGIPRVNVADREALQRATEDA